MAKNFWSLYQVLIGSGKTNLLFNLVSHQPDIDKIYLYAKDLYEAKHQFLINKTRKYRTKLF